MNIPVLRQIRELDPYVPGLSVQEIRERYGLSQVVKLASNENPLGASPRVLEAIARHAAYAFRYPQGGNPRLVEALARRHGVDADTVAVGNGSDEIIDLLIRMLAEPGRHSIVCCRPCFGLYPIQARIAGVEARRVPLKEDFSFDLPGLLCSVDKDTRLVFLTTPDNPSGYCPPLLEVAAFAKFLAQYHPKAVLVVDEAYVDFADDERASSLLAAKFIPENAVFMRTFSKSYGMAGMRLGYAVMPRELASCFWRMRLPFSVNILAEEAGLAALEDDDFRRATLETVREGRRQLTDGLRRLGCTVWNSAANFLLFRLPGDASAKACFEDLLQRGVIIRTLAGYELPEHLRVSVGTARENAIFLDALSGFLAETTH
ncbi:MAG: histidinol-phosphate transaminase [Desulfovibrio sp.]|jgi:histidinol-phosphate aminotransferase|nr:histidinol-phosphate transaminase [Desulfovibrio sp.]